MTSKRRNLIIAAIVLVVATGALIWAMRGNSAVDDYVAQLRAKGERFYFTDPPLPRMTNGTPALDKLVSAADSISGSVGVEVMSVNTAGVAQVSWRQDVATTPSPAPSNSGYWTQLLTKLNKNEKPLSEIRESVVHPEPDMGWQTNIATFRRVYAQQRNASRLLAAATVAELHETNAAAAFENLQALAHLAQMESNETTMVSQMIRVAIAGLGLSTTWEALQSDGFTDSQWAQLQAEWEKIDLCKAMEQAFVGERVWVFSHMEMARKGDTNAVNWSGTKISWQDRIGTAVWRATVARQDEMFYLKTLERYIDLCRLASRGTAAAEVNRMFQRDMDQLIQVLTQRSARFKYPFSSIAIPNFSRATTNAFHGEVQRRLTITAIGIKRYQMRHGKMPESLSALVPQFCSEVLLDPMDWKPLRYQTNANGTFTLYSVGDNGKDDGGNPTWTTNAYANWLSGMDIVWPKRVQVSATK